VGLWLGFSVDNISITGLIEVSEYFCLFTEWYVNASLLDYRA